MQRVSAYDGFTDMIQYYRDNVTRCPVCGSRLELNPNTGWLICVQHGTFTIIAGSIVWERSK